MFGLMGVASCYTATLCMAPSFDPNDRLVTLIILGSEDITHSDKEFDSRLFFFFDKTDPGSLFDLMCFSNFH